MSPFYLVIIIIDGGQLLDLTFPQVQHNQLNKGDQFLIQEKVILIPRNPLDNKHVLYSSLTSDLNYTFYDEFADLLKMVEDNSTART